MMRNALTYYKLLDYNMGGGFWIGPGWFSWRSDARDWGVCWEEAAGCMPSGERNIDRRVFDA